MRIVGVTQGSGLGVFLGLMNALEEAKDAMLAGVFVSDSGVFRQLAAQYQTLRTGAIPIEKEWEIVSEGLRTPGDPAVLKAYETEIGEPVWYTLLADRRIFFGRYSKRMQDYRPKLSEAQMRGVATVALKRVGAFLESTRPDAIVTLGTATIGEYLFAKLAAARGIHHLQLRATKIKNYVCLSDQIVGLSSHIRELYKTNAVSEAARTEARAYMAEVHAKGAQYEGIMLPDKRPGRFQLRRTLSRVARGLALELRRQMHQDTRSDNHLDGHLVPSLIESFVQPRRARAYRRRYGKSFLGTGELATLGKFAVYPLHFEPEVAIQVQGRPYQNQIEVVRALALALPADVPLVLKEHPRSLGFRPIGYYRKLLEIPNVRFADPLVSSIALVRHAALVVVISGTIGLEAAILGKPVLVFGRPTYSALPDQIITLAQDPWELPHQIRRLLERGPALEAEPIERFIAANVEGSVPVDLYSALLGKLGRLHDATGQSAEAYRADNLQRLSTYTRLRLQSALQHSGDERTDRLAVGFGAGHA